MKKLLLGTSFALILLLAAALPAQAATGVTVQGVVQSVDELGGTFTILADNGSTYVVTPPASFDFTTIAVGDSVEVFGDTDAAGNLAASSVAPVAAETSVSGTVQSVDYATCTVTILTDAGDTVVVHLPDGADCSGIAVGDAVSYTGAFNADGSFSAIDPTADYVNNGFYCSNPDVQHPALTKLADNYEADYQSLLNEFCEGGLGVGGIHHALAAASMYGVSMDEILAMRETMGWGQIWKALKEAAGETGPSGSPFGAKVKNENSHAGGNGNNGNHGGGNSNNNGNNAGGNGNGHAGGNDKGKGPKK